jgi:hypothetical protein
MPGPLPNFAYPSHSTSAENPSRRENSTPAATSRTTRSGATRKASTTQTYKPTPFPYAVKARPQLAPGVALQPKRPRPAQARTDHNAQFPAGAEGCLKPAKTPPSTSRDLCSSAKPSFV